MKKILTLTMNPALDIAASVPRLMADVKLRCSDPLYDPGGGGINVARAIKRLGGDALALYPVGGSAGETVRNLLDREGVHSRVVPIQGATRENFAVTDAETGEQYRFSLPGPELTAAEIDKLQAELAALLPEMDFFVISGGLAPGQPDDFYGDLIREAKGEKAKVILDVGGAPLLAAMHEGVYLVRLNRTDFHALTGVFPKQPSDVEPFVQEWLAKGWAEVVVITLSQRGTIVMTPDHCTEILPPSVKPVSAVGAGDSFVGGLTCALAAGRSLEDAAAYATAALLSALQSPGTELCRRDEVEAFYAGMTTRAGASYRSRS